MRILDRYIARHVIGGTAIALAVLVAVFSVVELVDDIDSVGRGEYTLGGAVEYLLLRIPGRLFAMFPVSALIGSVMGLGLMTSSSELTVMRAAGVSVRQITYAVLKAGAALVVVVVVIGELVVPRTEQLATERRSVALREHVALRASQGLWVRDGLSFINARRVLPDSRLLDVYIYEFDRSKRLRVATHAARAVSTPQGWRLEEISQSEIAESGVQTREVDSAIWHVLFGPAQLSAVAIRPEALSAVGLFTYLRFLRDNGLNTARYELALWNKFVYPVATAIMVFVAVVLVLGPLRAVGLGPRIVAGIVLGLVFHIVQKTALHTGIVYQADALLAVLGPPLAFLGLGLWLLRRVG